MCEILKLGEEIRRAREEKHLSQEDLAEQLGVSRQAVSKWENGTALPQGINREMLNRILGLKVMQETEEADGTAKIRSRSVIYRAGWVLAVVMSAVLLVLGMELVTLRKKQTDGPADSVVEDSAIEDSAIEDSVAEDSGAESSPALKAVRFYDGDQNRVDAEALWYNAARIEIILLQWEGGTPASIRVFRIPTGSETMEQTELLLTKSIPDGDETALLNAEILKDIEMGHLFFELDFGTEIVTSEEFNIFYEKDG